MRGFAGLLGRSRRPCSVAALVLTALALVIVVAAPAGAGHVLRPAAPRLTVAPLAGEANQVIVELADRDWRRTRVARHNAAARAGERAGSFCSQLTRERVQVRCDDQRDRELLARRRRRQGDQGSRRGTAGRSTATPGTTRSIARDNTVANLFGDDGDDYLEAVGPLADVLRRRQRQRPDPGQRTGADVISGGAGTDTFLVAGGTWTVSLDDVANDGIPGTNGVQRPRRHRERQRRAVRGRR